MNLVTDLRGVHVNYPDRWDLLKEKTLSGTADRHGPFPGNVYGIT